MTIGSHLQQFSVKVTNKKNDAGNMDFLFHPYYCAIRIVFVVLYDWVIRTILRFGLAQ